MTKDGIKGKLLGAANQPILHGNLFSQAKNNRIYTLSLGSST